MKKLSLIISFCFLVISGVKAQQAFITLNDSVKIKTQLISVSENALTTRSGVFGLVEINSIRFDNQAEAQKNLDLLDHLLRTDIKIYVGETKIANKPKLPIQVHNTPKSTTDARSNVYEENVAKTGSIGFGLGLDYGGLGAQLMFQPEKHLGVFGSVGYALAGVGYNIGVMARLTPEKRVVPTVSFMYGYNGSIYIQNTFQKLYYGTSLAGGIILNSKRNDNTFWHFELVAPFRSNAYNSDYKFWYNAEPVPISICVGYHLKF